MHALTILFLVGFAVGAPLQESPLKVWKRSAANLLKHNPRSRSENNIEGRFARHKLTGISGNTPSMILLSSSSGTMMYSGGQSTVSQTIQPPQSTSNAAMSTNVQMGPSTTMQPTSSSQMTSVMGKRRKRENLSSFESNLKESFKIMRSAEYRQIQEEVEVNGV